MNPFYKGMTAGIIVGSTLALAVVPKENKSAKCIKRKTGKMLKTAGSVIDSIQSMM